MTARAVKSTMHGLHKSIFLYIKMHLFYANLTFKCLTLTGMHITRHGPDLQSEWEMMLSHRGSSTYLPFYVFPWRRPQRLRVRRGLFGCIQSLPPSPFFGWYPVIHYSLWWRGCQGQVPQTLVNPDDSLFKNPVIPKLSMRKNVYLRVD